MKLPSVAALKNASKPAGLALVSAVFLAWAVLVVSCATTTTNNRQVQIASVPGAVPGATFVGSDQCAACHDQKCKDFDSAPHSRLVAQGDNAKNAGCEACHGPGSAHVEAGGGKGTIINPKDSPEVCFQCHLDKRATFRLTNSHPVLAGRMSCTDCHDPHRGDNAPRTGMQVASRAGNNVNATCAKCHPTQAQPHAFEHPALREGCTFCHDPHGSPNAKMLKQRNSILCLQCHSQSNQAVTGGVLVGSGNHNSRLATGAVCWTAGCHDNIHGSNTNYHLHGGAN